mmetsp:Transcript_2765/g.4015  ORF Transcript_2765/g.4015 Transcript_2765/m.4015 type:complete len:260 (-) Transcript_2765:148-927(-)
MFSRGNITEKIRFAKLVQKGDIVLDMYAGIGYYTLPALIHGEASHVYACEWNTHALEALRYNLEQNGVENKATVLEGDSREQVKQAGLFGVKGGGGVNRVSLGLLPSSEGGWRTAINALRSDQGGWLHVHATVPTSEIEQWVHWSCNCFLNMARDMDRTDWIVVCNHVEKVKSFAPRILHIVADVFVGIKTIAPLATTTTTMDNGDDRCFYMNDTGTLTVCPRNVEPPSCAFNPNGVIHQAWLVVQEEGGGGVKETQNP